ncbi:MAG: DUF3592 domain-containing protein [Gloeomargarita sp. SKYBB_i_bin120]|nr:DUF3592 domain-containing protein [Gloeomargarita sp. SKYG98]MCS7291836.1 DUF3592 domain-containing protein [Gloeomargarita sp. SKYB120]MDW8177396.1 DUF3592 domain-containing protein [Gloeomargarita sp. SKYBB_i_bin120]
MARLVFVLIGLALLGVGLWNAHRTWQFLQGAVKTRGEVVDIERRWSRRTEDIDDRRRASRYSYSLSYYPVVEYSLPNGRRVRFTAKVGSDPPRYRLGQIVEVLYNPNDPFDARIDNFLELWLGPLFWGGFGLFFLVMGLVAPVRSGR